MVESKGKLVNEGDVIGDSCLRDKILEVGDVLLESIIHDFVRAFEQFLGKLGELKLCSDFGVIGEKCGFKVGSELVKGFVSIGDRDICHLVIPHF